MENTFRANSLVNRVIDVETQVGKYFEFEVLRMDVMNNVPYFVGRDINNKLKRIIVENIKSVSYKDTDEQVKLKRLNISLENFDNMAANNVPEEAQQMFYEIFKNEIEQRKVLIENGVTEYTPVRRK